MFKLICLVVSLAVFCSAEEASEGGIYILLFQGDIHFVWWPYLIVMFLYYINFQGDIDFVWWPHLIVMFLYYINFGEISTLCGDPT